MVRLTHDSIREEGVSSTWGHTWSGPHLTSGELTSLRLAPLRVPSRTLTLPWGTSGSRRYHCQDSRRTTGARRVGTGHPNNLPRDTGRRDPVLPCTVPDPRTSGGRHGWYPGSRWWGTERVPTEEGREEEPGVQGQVQKGLGVRQGPPPPQGGPRDDGSSTTTGTKTPGTGEGLSIWGRTPAGKVGRKGPGPTTSSLPTDGAVFPDDRGPNSQDPTQPKSFTSLKTFRTSVGTTTRTLTPPNWTRDPCLNRTLGST